MFSKAILAKTLTAKIAVAVCGVSVVGAATAAATNTLPSGLQSKAHSIGFPRAEDSALKRGTDLTGSQKGRRRGPRRSLLRPARRPRSLRRNQGADRHAALDAAGARLLGDDGFRLCRAAEDGDRDAQGHDLTATELQKLAKAANVPAADIAKLQSRLDAQRNEAQKRMQDFCDRLAQAEKDLRDGHTPKFPLPAAAPRRRLADDLADAAAHRPRVPTHLPTGCPAAAVAPAHRAALAPADQLARPTCRPGRAAGRSRADRRTRSTRSARACPRPQGTDSLDRF